MARASRGPPSLDVCGRLVLRDQAAVPALDQFAWHTDELDHSLDCHSAAVLLAIHSERQAWICRQGAGLCAIRLGRDRKVPAFVDLPDRRHMRPPVGLIVTTRPPVSLIEKDFDGRRQGWICSCLATVLAPNSSYDVKSAVRIGVTGQSGQPPACPEGYPLPRGGRLGETITLGTAPQGEARCTCLGSPHRG